MERNEIISYSLDFASYLILKIENIDRIVLFGSVARADFHEKSDIDIFVDCKKKIKNFDKLVNDYYKTKKFEEWKLKGIEKEFSVVLGDLDSDEWKDLRRAILVDGISLYGKFTGSADNMQHYVMFSFENIKPDKKRVAIFRALFGFRQNKKEYLGLIEKLNGVRIGKGSFLVPASQAGALKRYFHEKKISFKIYDIWSDDKF